MNTDTRMMPGAVFCMAEVQNHKIKILVLITVRFRIKKLIYTQGPGFNREILH